jgi:hypothetical protein
MGTQPNTFCQTPPEVAAMVATPLIGVALMS